VPALELPVAADSRLCPFCDQQITGHAAVAFMETGELRWCHQLCAIKVGGRGVSALLPRTKVAA
jgi:hypothetical protein